jgi:hypothetical protein
MGAFAAYSNQAVEEMAPDLFDETPDTGDKQ